MQLVYRLWRSLRRISITTAAHATNTRRIWRKGALLHRSRTTLQRERKNLSQPEQHRSRRALHRLAAPTGLAAHQDPTREKGTNSQGPLARGTYQLGPGGLQQHIIHRERQRESAPVNPPYFRTSSTTPTDGTGPSQAGPAYYGARYRSQDTALYSRSDGGVPQRGYGDRQDRQGSGAAPRSN